MQRQQIIFNEAAGNEKYYGAQLMITIISGGQTGVDRAALMRQWRLEQRLGMVPSDAKRKTAGIPDTYPLLEIPDGDYLQRTEKNVTDSDATLIIYFGSLSAALHKPWSSAWHTTNPTCCWTQTGAGIQSSLTDKAFRIAARHCQAQRCRSCGERRANCLPYTHKVLYLFLADY